MTAGKAVLEMTDDLTILTERLNGHSQRLAALETHKAVDAVRWENIAVRLDKIEGALTWLVRLIVGGIVMAFLAYALNGGLSI